MHANLTFVCLQFSIEQLSVQGLELFVTQKLPAVAA